jgi:hypothetical protein
MMDRVSQIGLVVLFGLFATAGCGKDSSPDATAAASAGGIVVNNAADPATNPVARAAFDFLDAVIKGDTERSKALLTPRAIQQIDESKANFKPAGLDNATFQIGEVRTPTESQAIVQCVLTQSSSDGNTRIEEMCCLMRLVDNQWRVSGIAAGNGPGRAPMILDFENPPRETAAQPPVAGGPGQEVSAPSPGRPSPPRTAQENSPSRY